MFRRKAILIIHGYAGGTYDEEPLANYLELERSFDVYSFTLPGHDVRDKKKATNENWINESERQIKYLINNGYKKIYVIGHSMGGVIAAYLGSKYKEVKKLVLVAPAFTCIASKEAGGLIAAIFKIPDLIKAYSFNEIATRVNKMPLSSEKEFINLVEDHKNDINNITVPIMFIHGTKDQLVPINSTEKIYENYKSNKKKLLVVEDYYHDVFKGEKVELICKEIKCFLKKRKYRIKEEKKEI